MILDRFRLLAHEHSLKLRPHAHTSYPTLMFLLMITTVVVLSVSIDAQGAVQNPQSGSVGLSGTVPGPPPSQAAVITSPRSGDHTTSIPITVSGGCPNGTFVFIDKNGVLAGQTACNGGLFSLQIDLFGGTNQLVARVVDALGQSGPDSSPVSVIYDQPSSGTNSASFGRQLFLEADSTVVAGQPGTQMSRTVKIVGGTSPYALSWDWGDGSTSLATVTSEGSVTGNHAYATPGTYQVVVRVSDAAQNAAFLELVTVVNGPLAAVTGSSRAGGGLPGQLLAIWPLLVLAIILVLAFWMGEKRGAKRESRKALLAVQ